MTYMLASLANGKLVVALEVREWLCYKLFVASAELYSACKGGYNLESISKSALAVAEVLLGNPPPMMPELVASEISTETVWFVARVQSTYWKSIDVKACEPKDGE
jgi:histone deacetylase 6